MGFLFSFHVFYFCSFYLVFLLLCFFLGGVGGLVTSKSGKKKDVVGREKG